MRITLGMMIFICVSTVSLLAQSDEAVAKEIIALTRAQWAAEVAKDYDKSNAVMADEYTEFNSDFPVRIDGKARNVKIYECSNKGGGASLMGDMVNEKVQVYGDVAILSYNYIGMSQDKDSKVEPTLAKSTRVYAKKDGKWMLVHANFAPVQTDD